MNKKHLGIGGGVLVAIAAIAAIVMNMRGEELEEVQTANVERQKIIQKVNATGRIQPKTQIKISADVSAKITRLGVEEGDCVEEGQFLVELDRERYLAQVESAEANVRSAQSEAKLVRENMIKTSKEFDRSSELVRRGLESQSVLDTQQAAYQVEIARHESSLDKVEQAKATLKQAEVALSPVQGYRG